MRTIEQYEVKQPAKGIKHIVEVRPAHPINWHIWVDGKLSFGGILFDRKEIDQKLKEWAGGTGCTVTFLGERPDDAITPERKEELRRRAAHLHPETSNDSINSEQGDPTMKTTKKVRTPKAPRAAREKKEGIRIFGLRPGAFFHWMRDKKFTLTEAIHILTAQGFNIGPKRENPKTILLHTLRAHLHCKCEVVNAATPDSVEAVMKLKAAAPAADVKEEKKARKAREASGLLPGPRDEKRAKVKRTKKAAPKTPKAAQAPKAPKAGKPAAPKATRKPSNKPVVKTGAVAKAAAGQQ